MAEQGECVAGGMRGRGHAWQGVCLVGGGGHTWQILRDTLNERAVRILLECILVTVKFCLDPTVKLLDQVPFYEYIDTQDLIQICSSNGIHGYRISLTNFHIGVIYEIVYVISELYLSSEIGYNYFPILNLES